MRFATEESELSTLIVLTSEYSTTCGRGHQFRECIMLRILVYCSYHQLVDWLESELARRERRWRPWLFIILMRPFMEGPQFVCLKPRPYSEC